MFLFLVMFFGCLTFVKTHFWYFRIWCNISMIIQNIRKVYYKCITMVTIHKGQYVWSKKNTKCMHPPSSKPQCWNSIQSILHCLVSSQVNELMSASIDYPSTPFKCTATHSNLYPYNGVLIPPGRLWNIVSIYHFDLPWERLPCCIVTGLFRIVFDTQPWVLKLLYELLLNPFF